MEQVRNVSRPIKIVMYGIAHDHAPMTMTTLKKYPDVFDIVGMIEPNEEFRKTYGTMPEFEGIPYITEEEMFARGDVEAAAIESHEYVSVEYAQKCVDHGIAIHLDKPGGIDMPAFKKVLTDAENKNIPWQMGYMYRQNPAFKYVLEKVKEGKIGEITGIDGTFSILHKDEKRQWLAQFPGGMMFFIGCHIIDMIMLLNGTPTGVHAFNRSSDINCDHACDSAFAVLDYPHGVCSIRSNATDINGYARRELNVVGTKGTLHIQPLECPTVMYECYADEHSYENRAKDVSRLVFPGYLVDRYDPMMLEFAAMVRGEFKNPISKEYEFELQRVVMLASGMEVKE